MVQKFIKEIIMKRCTGQFTAYDEANRKYTIYEDTEFVDASSHSDPKAVLAGLKSLRTSNGVPVNYMKKGEYKIVATGQVLWSREPTAP